MKENSFVFNANMKEVTLNKNGAQVLLTVEDTDFLEVSTQLSNTAGYDVVVKVIPTEMVVSAESAEDIIRGSRGNDYTWQELERIKEALEEQHQEWRKRNFN